MLAAVRTQWPRRTGVLLRGNPASASTGPGHPDIDGVVRSRAIALEIKKARGKPTPLQALRIRDLRDVGCYAWIVRSPSEACLAVYWVAKGWTRPLSNEPLDLNDWLMGEPPKMEAEPYISPGAEIHDETPPVPDDLGAYTPEHKEAAARVMGYESAAQRDEVDPPVAKSYAQLDKDIRTVGDRVTMVWERQEMFLAVLQALDAKVSTILGMIEEDPGVDDSSLAQEIVFNGTSDAAESVPEAKPRRTRKARTVVQPTDEDLTPSG